MDEVYEISRKENRQQQIETMDIGDSVSIARRVELQHGFADGAIAEHNRQIRGIMDQQAHRARRRQKHHKYKVENGSLMTRDGALLLVAVCTRVE